MGTEWLVIGADVGGHMWNSSVVLAASGSSSLLACRTVLSAAAPAVAVELQPCRVRSATATATGCICTTDPLSSMPARRTRHMQHRSSAGCLRRQSAVIGCADSPPAGSWKNSQS